MKKDDTSIIVLILVIISLGLVAFVYSGIKISEKNKAHRQESFLECIEIIQDNNKCYDLWKK